jgi:hypothetical protein
MLSTFKLSPNSNPLTVGSCSRPPCRYDKRGRELTHQRGVGGSQRDYSGWSSPMPVCQAKPGDVIAQAHGPSYGHSGVVVGPGETVSVNSTTNPAGIVTRNNWGFRPRGANGEGPNDPAPVVRSYTGGEE